MELYVRFMASLAFGLFGMGLVLTIVLDELFGDWNAAHQLHSEVSGYFAERMRRRDDVGERLRRELDRARATNPGLRQLEQRREELNQLASVERRLQAPPRGVTVTPLPVAKTS